VLADGAARECSSKKSYWRLPVRMTLKWSGLAAIAALSVMTVLGPGVNTAAAQTDSQRYPEYNGDPQPGYSEQYAPRRHAQRGQRGQRDGAWQRGEARGDRDMRDPGRDAYDNNRGGSRGEQWNRDGRGGNADRYQQGQGRGQGDCRDNGCDRTRDGQWNQRGRGDNGDRYQQRQGWGGPGGRDGWRRHARGYRVHGGQEQGYRCN
jgi:hypothetical protein